MLLIFLICLVLVTWPSPLNFGPLTKEPQTEANPIDVWANDVKEMLYKLADDDLSTKELGQRIKELKEKTLKKVALEDEKEWIKKAQELLSLEGISIEKLKKNENFIENVRELLGNVERNEMAGQLLSEEFISEDKRFQKQIERRLKSELEDYTKYAQFLLDKTKTTISGFLKEKFKLLVIKNKKFAKILKNNFGKELGTFLIEYELLMVVKKIKKKENLDKQLAKILDLMQNNETYCDKEFIEKAKKELLPNIANNDKGKAVQNFIESAKFNIFENEMKAKIGACNEFPYIFLNSYVRYLGYMENYWPKMDSIRWGKLDKTLDEIYKKNIRILQINSKDIFYSIGKNMDAREEFDFITLGVFMLVKKTNEAVKSDIVKIQMGDNAKRPMQVLQENVKKAQQFIEGKKREEEKQK